MIEFLRKWSKQYFSENNSLCYPKNVLLKNRFLNSEGEKDLTVMVVEKKYKEDDFFNQIDENERLNDTVLFVMDETDACQVHCAKSDFDFIEKGDILRIRSVKCEEK